MKPIPRAGTARFSGLKFFLLAFLGSTVLAPAAAFGLTRLAYLVFGIETDLGLEALTIIGLERQAVVFGVALLIGLALLFAANRAGKRTVPAEGNNGLLLSMFVLLISAPCLLQLDQAIYLHVLDNPFPAARHMIMYMEGWGLLLFFWQLTVCLGFVLGRPGISDQRDTSGLAGVDRGPINEQAGEPAGEPAKTRAKKPSREPNRRNGR